MKKNIFLFCFFFLFINKDCISQTYYSNVPTTGATFLNTPSDVIQTGMGNAGLATDASEYASLVNIAKTTFSKHVAGIAATYSPWLNSVGVKNTYIASLSGFYQLTNNEAATLAFKYNGQGNQEVTDEEGNSKGSFPAHDMALELGYAAKLASHIAMGLTLKYINSNFGRYTINNIDFKPAHSVAADISFLYRSSDEKDSEYDDWAIGAVLSNLGSKLSYSSSNGYGKSFLPANLGIGGAYKRSISDNNTISVAADINKLLVPATPASTNHYAADSLAIVDYAQKSVISSWINSFTDGSNQLADLKLSIGLEYGINETVFCRLGYAYANKSIGGNKYFTIGLGTHFNVYGIDISYIPPSGTGIDKSPLSNTLRIGINVLFGSNDNL